MSEESCDVVVLKTLKKIREKDTLVKKLNKKAETATKKIDKAKEKLDAVKEKIEKQQEQFKEDFARNSVREMQRMVEIADKVNMTSTQRIEYFGEYYSKSKLYEVQKLDSIITDENILNNFERISNLPQFANDPKEIMEHIIRQAEGQEVDTRRKYGSILINGLDHEKVTDYVNEYRLEPIEGTNDMRQVFVNHADIKKELRELRDDGTGNSGITKNPMALAAAKVFRKFYNAIYNDVSSLGTNLGKIQGYTGFQNWDSGAFADASVDGVIEDFLEHIDRGAYPSYYDDEMFVDILTNFHKKMQGMTREDPRLALGDTNLFQSTLERMTNERGIHLTQQGEDILLAKYGRGNLLEDALEYANMMSKGSTLISNFGVLPEAGFDRLGQLLINKSSKENLDSVKRHVHSSKTSFLAYSQPGRLGTGNTKIEQIGNNIKGLISGIKLTLNSAIRAGLVDPAMVGFFMEAHVGENPLSGIPKFMKHVYHASADKKKTFALMGNMYEISRQDQLNRLGVDIKAKGVAKVIHILHKITGMQYQQTRYQSGARFNGSALLADLVENTAKGAVIDPKLKAYANIYGMDAEMLKMLPNYLADHNGIMVIDEMKLLTDDTLTGKARAKLRLATTRFLNGIERAMVIPGSREHSTFNTATAGTIWGQIQNLMGTFKNYPIASWNAIMENKRYNHAADPSSRVSTYGPLMGQALALMTTYYMSYIALEYARGKTPEDMSPELLLKIAVGSGAIGLWGEAALTDWDTNKGITGAKALGGPAIQTGMDMYEAIQEIVKLSLGKEGGKKPDPKRLIKQLTSMIPGSNTAFAKPVMDFVFMDSFKDWYDPDWRKKEKKRMKETGQTYLFK